MYFDNLFINLYDIHNGYFMLVITNKEEHKKNIILFRLQNFTYILQFIYIAIT